MLFPQPTQVTSHSPFTHTVARSVHSADTAHRRYRFCANLSFNHLNLFAIFIQIHTIKTEGAKPPPCGAGSAQLPAPGVARLAALKTKLSNSQPQLNPRTYCYSKWYQIFNVTSIIPSCAHACFEVLLWQSLDHNISGHKI